MYLQSGKLRATALAAIGFSLSLAPSMPALADAPPLPAWDKPSLMIGKIKPDLVLTGTVTRPDFQHNLEVPFDVPPGVTQISIRFDYTRPDGKTTIDFGLFEGKTFRGWSGSNKHMVTVGENNATASYIPGAIGGRHWAMDLGVAYVGEGITSTYTAKIYFQRANDVPAVSTFSPEPLQRGARWYRGDFHMHTGESDGFCASKAGRSIPCPVFKTIEAAEAAHLDFIAITDHNSVGHFNTMRELQPYFDDVLLIPGREITTYEGHANIFGTTSFVDYRLGRPTAPDMATILHDAVAKGAIVSVNHPTAPTNAECRGCGWTAPAAAMTYVSAMEAMNAGNLWRQLGGQDAGKDITRWEQELAQGRRMTALGGSDNHDVRLGRLGIGFPTTIVYATDLSEHAILDGVRAGHVWVDMSGELGHEFSLEARSGAQAGIVGDDFMLARGATLTMTLHLGGLQGYAVKGFVDGQSDAALSQSQVAGNDARRSFQWTSDGKRHWIRFEVLDCQKRVLFSNPVYINFSSMK